MKMKLAFSLLLALILLIAISSPILLINTSSPVLAHDHGGNGDGGNGGDDGGDHNGDDDGGDHDGGDDGGDHNGGDDGGDHNGGDDGGDHNGDDDGDHGNEAGFTDAIRHALIEQGIYPEDIEALWQMEPPEGQSFGDVQSIRDWKGDIIVSADGIPVLGRQIFDKITGAPIKNYANNVEGGEDIFVTNVGRVSFPMTYHRELGPGFRSGPGYERFKYTPPPGFEDSSADDQTEEPPPPPEVIPEPEDQDDDQDDEPSPSEAFKDDDTQFSKPRPVIDSSGSPRVDEDGTPVLGRIALDKEGEPVIGPNGKPITVIPD